MEAPVQYARTSDGVSIAYYAIGQGQPLVYMAPGSHLEREWQYPEQRAWLERLASGHRLIRFDHRGTGLSDWDTEITLEDGVLDIEAVARRERLNRFALLGQLYSGAMAVLYACKHPESVSHLILWSPYANFREFSDSAPSLQASRAAAAIDFNTHTELLAQMITGWNDADQARRFAAYLREFSTSDKYLTSVSRFADFDLTPRLAELKMPVLILHRREAQFPAVEVVRKVAANTPGARLVLLEGRALVPFLSDSESVLRAINEFLAETNEQARPGGLSERELEILGFLAGGNSNAGIAQALTISTRTVERHIENIYLKIGAHNRAEATAYAFRNGIDGVRSGQ
jgi:pimeloyl-ACP methyl ester carboxylesterase/DNA-binding CsgD family transcriptional regulator